MGFILLTLVGLFHLFIGDQEGRFTQDALRDQRELDKLLAEEKLRREAMGTKTIKIELRYNSESETDKVMRQVTRECARTLMASAMLVSSGRAPQIAVTCEDAFAADQHKIDLMMDELDESPELEQEGAEA